jgi:hypothetical protein
MDSISRSLVAAQNKAAALFDEVVDSGMIRAGKLESELTDEIHSLAQARFGVRRHWHKRIARSGPNTLTAGSTTTTSSTWTSALFSRSGRPISGVPTRSVPIPPNIGWWPTSQRHSSAARHTTG